LGQHVRTIKATFDPVETQRRQAQRLRRHRALPAPGTAAVTMTITVLEVQAGLRPPQQLERLCHHSLWEALAELPEPSGKRHVPIAPRPKTLTVQELVPGLVDATVVVLNFEGAAHALALRLDGAPGFWQLVELDYPTSPALTRPVPQLQPRPRRDPADLTEPAWLLDPLLRANRHLPPVQPADQGIELE
jgi:hypothetical protein